MGLTDLGQKTSAQDHARRVREMFARISPRYDLLNHLLSANIDRRWRQAVVRKLQPLLTVNAQILDVGCGTGDLSIALFEKTAARVIGVDFCHPMLEIATRKAPRLRFIEGDALRLPFPDAAFDAVTIGFGLRNVTDRTCAVRNRKFRRTATPGIRALVALYYKQILPWIGGWLSGSPSAYEYLPDSISHFPNQQKLVTMMREAGFEEVSFQNLTGGIAALHTGRRM